MSHAIPYLFEKFLGAIDALATSPRSIQQRLVSAYMSIAPLKEADFPEGEMRDKFAAIWHRLEASEPVGDKGTIDTLCEGLADDAASALAGEFVELFDLLIVADHSFYVDRKKAQHS